MGIDREEVTCLVVEPVIAGKQDERRRIGRFHDHVGDHHFEFLDSPRCGRGGFGLQAHS
jgi:hypothetical protein